MSVNIQKSTKLVTLVKSAIYTRDMYNDRKDMKEENKLERKYELGNTESQMKQ